MGDQLPERKIERKPRREGWRSTLRLLLTSTFGFAAAAGVILPVMTFLAPLLAPQLGFEEAPLNPRRGWPLEPERPNAYDPPADPYVDYDLSPSGLNVLLAYPAWPPEYPSARISLLGMLDPSPTDPTLLDVSLNLNAILESANYHDYGYYSVPGGFVIVTQPEAIADDAVALAGTARFPRTLRPTNYGLTIPASLIENKNPIYLRYVAIVVTDNPYRFERSTLDVRAAQERFEHSATALSAVVANTPFTKAHRVDALIYEFVKDVGYRDEYAIIVPSRFPGDTHLEAMGIRAIGSP